MHLSPGSSVTRADGNFVHGVTQEINEAIGATVIVAGGRDLPITNTYVDLVVQQLIRLNAGRVLTGGARGGDQIGRFAAMRLGLPYAEVLPNWEAHGKKAGPIRNIAMCRESRATACILLPGGRGTNHMKNTARKYGIRVVFAVRRPT